MNKILIAAIIIFSVVIPQQAYTQSTSNLQNIHIEQQDDIRYLVWEQQNASKLKISQSSNLVDIDIILFASPGINSIEIERRTMIFDTYDNKLYGPFRAYQTYISIARR